MLLDIVCLTVIQLDTSTFQLTMLLVEHVCTFDPGTLPAKDIDNNKAGPSAVWPPSSSLQYVMEPYIFTHTCTHIHYTLTQRVFCLAVYVCL